MGQARSLIPRRGLTLADLRGQFQTEAGRLVAQFRSDPTARRAVQLFAAAGVAILGASILRDMLRYGDIHISILSPFSLTRDHAIPELFMYLCEATCSAACFRSYAKTGRKAFLFFGVLFAFIVLDDALEYHEVMGRLIAERLESASRSLDSQNLGEVVAWCIAAVVLFPPLVWCIARMQRDELGIYLVFALVFAGLVVFAVGVDLVHALSKQVFEGHERTVKIVGRLLGWVEDGGELLMVTVAACVGLLYWRNTGNSGQIATG